MEQPWPDSGYTACGLVWRQQFVRLCLHLADSRSGAVIPWLLDAPQQDAVVRNVFNFDCLHLGGAEDDDVLAAEAGLVLTLVEGITRFVWLEPTRFCDNDGADIDPMGCDI